MTISYQKTQSGSLELLESIFLKTTEISRVLRKEVEPDFGCDPDNESPHQSLE